MKKSKLLALVIAMAMAATLFAGCGTPGDVDTTTPTTTPSTTSPTGTTAPAVVDLSGHKDPKFYTYNDYIGSFATDWNPHTWETNADSAVLTYLSSGLYEFKFNDDQSAAELFPLMASADPVDVTGKLTAQQKANYGIPADATDGYAYQYALRDDVKFNDGTVINAQTYVDSLKLLLDPLRHNGRVAEQSTGEAPIAGARGYYNQGKVSYAAGGPSSNTDSGVFWSMTNAITWAGGTMEECIGAGYDTAYFTVDGVNLVTKWNDYALANGGYNEEGYARIADADLEEFIADWTAVSTTSGGGYEGEWKEFIFTSDDFSDPKYSDFNNVGVIADEEFVVTFVYAVKVSPFNAKYYQTSTWLVHPELYEQCSKVEGDMVTTTYHTGLDSSASYGPYILSAYETDKEMLFVRNEDWFGYKLEAMNGCYQPDAIRVKQIADQPTALLSFLKGEIDDVALAATDLVDYGTSDYLLVTPETYLYRLFYNLGSDVLKALDSNSSANSNTVALTNQSFRLAISVGLDRNEWTKISNRAPAFAMVNELYTYDYEGEMADGAAYRYRDLDVAKEAILNVYDIKWGAGTQYPTLDMAVDSVTGYDPALASKLMKQAFEELSADSANNGFDPSKPIHILIGYTPSVINPTGEALQAEFNAKMKAAIEGSGFAGFTIEFVVDTDRYGAVTEGRLAASYGAIGGARQDPWGISRGFLDPGYSLYLGANIPVDVDTLAITSKFDGVTESTQTKTLYDWNVALNSDLIDAPVETKADILSALESFYLKQGYTTPIESSVVTQMHSIRTSYPLDEPDPIMAFGGMQYVTFSMDDTEWSAYVSANVTDGALAYK